MPYYFVVFHVVTSVHKFPFRFLTKRTHNCQHGGRISESGHCGYKYTDGNLESCDLTCESWINLKMVLFKFTFELKSTMNGIVRMLKEETEVMHMADRLDSIDVSSHVHTQD